MLAGKNAVVLGGTGVLGSAMVTALARSGADVLVLGRNETKLESLKQELAIHQLTIRTRLCDSENFAQLRDLADELPPTDILVAGIGGNMPGATLMPDRSISELDPEQIKAVVDLNLFPGAVNPLLAFGSKMESGSMITIASASSDLPLSRVGGYGAAKAAVTNFTKWAAVEFGRRTHGKVRVNGIQPGFFITEQNRFLLTDRETGLPTERGQLVLNHTPTGRFGEPNDLDGALLFLASDASQFVTGAILPVDGGFTAWWGV